MSDLQCPATFYVLRGGADDGRAEQECAEQECAEQACAEPDVPADVAQAAIALVYAAPSRAACAGALAAQLGCAWRVEPELAQTSHTVVWALEGLADLHRGESVVALPARRLPAHQDAPWLRVRIDADGAAIDVVS